MPLLGDTAATVGLDTMFADQANQYIYPFSVLRYDQWRVALSQALGQVIGTGVVVGGDLSDSGGLSVDLAADTVIFAGGVAWLVDSTLTFGGLIDGTNVINTVWGTIIRTVAADLSDRSSPDTYALAMGASLDDTPPAGGHAWFRLGFVPVNGGAVGGSALGGVIDNSPPGKFCWAHGNQLQLGPPAITVDAEVSNVVSVHVQLGDVTGADSVARGGVELWLADAAYGAETATVPSGGWAVTTGVKLADAVTNKRATFIADNTGLIELDVTHSSAHVYYLNVRVGDVVYPSTALTFT